MKVIFRMTSQYLQNVRRDLHRPHRHAAERVGFISVRAARTAKALILLAKDYHPVADEDYVNNPMIGAMINQEAIRKALNHSLLKSDGMFHVHMHEHEGRPRFSRLDLREQEKFVPDFFKVCRQLPHGAIVLSHDSEIGRVWLDPETVVKISEFNVVGPQVTIDILRPDGDMGVLA